MQERTAAKNSFKKDFFKLLNNAICGKTMKNLCNRVDVQLVTDEKKLSALTSKPTFVSFKIFNKNLMAVHKVKESLTLSKPSYVGMSILDIRKSLMYDFHHNYSKESYGKKRKLLSTDTDSLCYKIKSENVFQDFWKRKNKFDFSDYPKESPYHDDFNEKVIGKMKDKAAGQIITEFISLQSKMYSYIKESGSNNKTTKGIKKNVIHHDLKHDDFKSTPFNNDQLYHTMRTIGSDNHNIGTYEINKVSLSCFDDKRYLKDDGIASFAYGHYKMWELTKKPALNNSLHKLA